MTTPKITNFFIGVQGDIIQINLVMTFEVSKTWTSQELLMDGYIHKFTVLGFFFLNTPEGKGNREVMENLLKDN